VQAAPSILQARERFFNRNPAGRLDARGIFLPVGSFASSSKPTFGDLMTKIAHPPSKGQGNLGMSDGTGTLQIRSVDGKCLDASGRNTLGGLVHMWPCNIHNENQQWTFNRATHQLKAKHGKCLDASQRTFSGGKIHMWNCNPANINQQWEISTGINQIKAKHGICLDAANGVGVAARSTRNDNGGKVQMGSCNVHNKDQMWALQRCEVQDFLGSLNGWGPFGSSFGGAEAFVSGGMCTVSGLIKGAFGSTNGFTLTVLPANCRPSKKLTFNLNNLQTFSSMVQVHTNGQVEWKAGGRVGNWLSLSGITFATSADERPVAAPYGSGFYDAGLGRAEASVSGGICAVSGVVGGMQNAAGHHARGAPAVMVTLPANCRPSKRLVFSLNSGQYSARVDVKTNGQVTFETGFRNDGMGGGGTNNGHWLSLAGITFAPHKQSEPLRPNGSRLSSGAQAEVPYKNGWGNFGQSFGGAEAVVSGGSCMVSGLIKSFGHGWGHVATLPENCRPNRRLIFNLNNDQSTSRVDVLANGEVHWKAGGSKGHGWFSLTGITFTPESAYICK